MNPGKNIQGYTNRKIKLDTKFTIGNNTYSN